MKAVIENVYFLDEDERHYSPEDISDFQPENPRHFRLDVWVVLRPDNDDSFSHAFSLRVVGVEWFSTLNRPSERENLFPASGYAVMFEYRFEDIVKHVDWMLDYCQGETWEEVANLWGMNFTWHNRFD